MFKLIPHCAKGSWVVSQSVGTTPVILGRKLATTYHLNNRWVHVATGCKQSVCWPSKDIHSWLRA